MWTYVDVLLVGFLRACVCVCVSVREGVDVRVGRGDAKGLVVFVLCSLYYCSMARRLCDCPMARREVASKPNVVRQITPGLGSR